MVVIVTLSQANDSFPLSIKMWKTLLEMARNQGWDPVGCLPPIKGTPSGSPPPQDDPAYKSSDGQLLQYLGGGGVSMQASDALALADALDRALVHLPDEDMVEKKERAHYRKFGGTRFGLIIRAEDHWGGPARKNLLRLVVSFLRQGEISILLSQVPETGRK